MPANDKKPTLPTKEAQLFRSVVKFYESRQYKKGLKAADTVLKKFPNHGETLAMKGLTLNCMNRKEEAYDYVRRGLKFDLASHVCWHVYGLLYRSDRDYNEAVKCYKNALRNDKDNLQILRDLALLQVQLRDIEGYMETWRKILTLKPTQRTNWISFAMGAHLSGDHNKSIQILDEYLKIEPLPEKPNYETSELLMYKDLVYAESGNYAAALEHLDNAEKDVVDKISVKEKRAEYLNKLKRFDEAKKAFKDLLQLNPDDHKYHRGLLIAHGLVEDSAVITNTPISPQQTPLTAEQAEQFVNLYEELKKEHPRSDAAKSIPLSLLPAGDHFQRYLDDYVKRRIRRGVPSLFRDLKVLYGDEAKVQLIEKTFLQYVQHLSEQGKFDAKEEKKEDPDAIMWAEFYLAQHFDVRGETEKAIQYIGKVIDHTPTLIEAHLVKGKIYKNAGHYAEAARVVDQARSMDLADRYLNNKCAKYQIRADQLEKANATLALFTKEGESPALNLHDMQATWYETATAESYLRQGNWGMALKRLLDIHKHFGDIADDQLDFHSYCLRKMTLRSYISMLRLEDELYGHPFYVRGMKLLIQTYIDLHDNPPGDDKPEEDPALAGMDPAERKKYLSKKRKDEAKKKELEEKQAKEQKTDSKKKAQPEDPDPEGKLLVKAEDKLKEATKYLALLKQHAAKDVEVQVLAFEVYIRKKKFLLALQAVHKALSIDVNHPDTHRIVIKFFLAVEKAAEGSLHASVKEVIQSQKESILKGKTLEQLNKEFLEKNGSYLAHRAAAAEMMVAIAPTRKDEALKLLLNTEGAKGRKDMKECEKIRTMLLKTFDNKEAAEQFRVLSNKVFPHAIALMDEQQKTLAKKDQESEQQ